MTILCNITSPSTFNTVHITKTLNMDYVLENIAFNETVGCNMEYYADFGNLKTRGEEFEEAIDVLAKTHLINTRQRGVFVFTDNFNDFQIFDSEIILHLQHMANQFVYYADDLLALYEEKLQEKDEGKKFISQYTNVILFKNRLRVTRNKYFNMIYKLLECEKADSRETTIELYCQLFYSGPSLFSPSLTTRVTFPLSKFRDFLQNHTSTLHMYSNSNVALSGPRRIGKDTYKFQAWGDMPHNQYEVFHMENKLIEER